MTGGTFAAVLMLVWTFTRSTAPPPDGFVLTAQHGGQTDTLHVTPSAVGACQDDDPDTYCAQWPDGCPAEGVYTLSVQAVRGKEQSGIETTLVCQFTELVPCQCVPPVSTGSSAGGGMAGIVPSSPPLEGTGSAGGANPLVSSSPSVSPTQSSIPPKPPPAMPTFPVLAPVAPV